MKTRTSVILAVAGAAVLVAGLLYGTGNREQQDTVPQGQLAFQNLVPKLQDAAEINIVHHGAALKLVRNNTVWGVAARSNYPADLAKVHKLTDALAELKLDEPRSANPDDYARLGVEDAEGKDANSTLIRVLDSSGAPIAALIAGHQHTGSHGNGDGTYVRRPGEAQSWLAQGSLTASADPLDWLDTKIADAEAPEVTAMTVTRDGRSLSFVKKDGHMTLTTPGDFPKLDQFKLDDMAHGLQRMNLLDVRPAPAPGKLLGQGTMTIKSGETFTVTVNTSSQEVWIQISATGEGAAKAAADALNARANGWAYKIDEWRQQSFVPSIDELKEYTPPANPAPAPAPAAGLPDIGIVPPVKQ